MGLFNLFNKKKEQSETHYDPINIKVSDMEKGYIFEYDLRTWTVKKMFEYDWGDNFFTREFLIESGREKKHLHIEEDEELEIELSEEIKFRTLPEDFIDSLIKNNEPPAKLIFEGITYYRQSEEPGFWRNIDNDNWEEFVSWDFLDAQEEKVISISQWGEQDFEVSKGFYLSESEISNILPVQLDN